MNRIFSLAWSLNGRYLAAGGSNDRIIIWDIDRQAVLTTLQTPKIGVRSLCWSPDGEWLVCGQGTWKDFAPGLIQKWQVSTGKMVWSAPEAFYGTYSVDVSSNGLWLAAGHGCGVTTIWHAPSGQKYISTNVRDDVRNLINGISFSPDSQTVACGTCYEDGLYLYTLDGAVKQELVFPKQPSWVNFEHCLCFSPDGKYTARGSQTGLVTVWRVDDPLLSTDFTGHDAPVYAVDWSPDGRYLAGGSRYGRVIIWQPDSGEIVGSMRHRPLHTITYSPDGRFLAGAGDDARICIWDADPAGSNFGACVAMLPSSHSTEAG